MKKKEKGSIRDIAILNYNVLKRKTKSTGESVCLCTMERGSPSVLVALLSREGHIVESQVFVFTKNTEKQIMNMARDAYKNMLKIYLYNSN